MCFLVLKTRGFSVPKMEGLAVPKTVTNLRISQNSSVQPKELFKIWHWTLFKIDKYFVNSQAASTLVATKKGFMVNLENILKWFSTGIKIQMERRSLSTFGPRATSVDILVNSFGLHINYKGFQVILNGQRSHRTMESI